MLIFLKNQHLRSKTKKSQGAMIRKPALSRASRPHSKRLRAAKISKRFWQPQERWYEGGPKALNLSTCYLGIEMGVVFKEGEEILLLFIYLCRFLRLFFMGWKHHLTRSFGRGPLITAAEKLEEENKDGVNFYETRDERNQGREKAKTRNTKRQTV